MSQCLRSLTTKTTKKKDDAMDTMTPSQIGKVQEIVGAACRKAGLPSASVQHVLEHQGGQLTTEILAVLRRFVEAVSSLIVRVVTGVNRSLSPQQALDATGRKQYIDREVVEAMPRGEGDDKEVIFFQVGRNISDDDLEKEYEKLGFKPADTYSLVKVNQDDPAFADAKPNCTHWKDESGRWCYIAFSRWDDDGRNVRVNRNDCRWGGRWWFAGVRK